MFNDKCRKGVFLSTCLQYHNLISTVRYSLEFGSDKHRRLRSIYTMNIIFVNNIHRQVNDKIQFNSTKTQKPRLYRHTDLLFRDLFSYFRTSFWNVMILYNRSLYSRIIFYIFIWPQILVGFRVNSVLVNREPSIAKLIGYENLTLLKRYV